jgi:hypothetical protein
MFGVAVQLRSTKDLCGNREEKKLCLYKIGGLTVDVAGTLQSGSGGCTHYIAVYVNLMSCNITFRFKPRSPN